MTVTGASIPRLGRGMKLREDKARGQWVVLGPERMFVPDEIALEVLRLVDGTRDDAAIVDALAEKFAAPREVIESDVRAMLADLAGRGALLC